MPRITSYPEDLKEDHHGAWLKKNDRGEVIDVSTLFIEDTLPTNAQMFGMTEIANVLTSRTV